MLEILKAKLRQMPVEWVKYALIFFLGMTAVYYFMSLRQTTAAAANVIGLLQYQVQQQTEALNGQCQTSLERQGFVVERPPAPPQPEVKDNAER